METNRALSVLAQNMDIEREEMENRIASKLRSLIVPSLERLAKDKRLAGYKAELDGLISQVEDITSDFIVDERIASTLSFTELRIASLIKNGLSTEEIANQLHISPTTVRTHRKHIRSKLKIKNTQYSLRNFLLVKKQ
jgi:DNA-binding CsgD family transcriptional regulator